MLRRSKLLREELEVAITDTLALYLVDQTADTFDARPFKYLLDVASNDVDVERFKRRSGWQVVVGTSYTYTITARYYVEYLLWGSVIVLVFYV